MILNGLPSGLKIVGRPLHLVATASWCFPDNKAAIQNRDVVVMVALSGMPDASERFKQD